MASAPDRAVSVGSPSDKAGFQTARCSADVTGASLFAERRAVAPRQTGAARLWTAAVPCRFGPGLQAVRRFRLGLGRAHGPKRERTRALQNAGAVGSDLSVFPPQAHRPAAGGDVGYRVRSTSMTASAGKPSSANNPTPKPTTNAGITSTGTNPMRASASAVLPRRLRPPSASCRSCGRSRRCRRRR